MTTYGTYRVTEKKCATCNLFQGTRRIGLQAYKPFYVLADAGHAICQASSNRKVTANNKCLSWQKWVNLP
jgi:hypothetical protein